MTASIMILIMLSACARGLSGDFCMIYEPVYISPEDSEETLKQVDKNNAAWLEMCER